MELDFLITDHSTDVVVSIVPLQSAQLENFDKDPWVSNLVKTHEFKAKPGQMLLIPDQKTGDLSQVLVGIDPQDSLWSLGNLPNQLPAGDYQLWDPENVLNAELATLGFGLGAYRFDRYKKSEKKQVRLVIELHLLKPVTRLLEAIYWVRDLINTPAEDMGPEHLSQEAQKLAQEFGGDFREVVGEALLDQNYGAIHAVGRAATRAPRLIELNFGDDELPKLTLVGKGVCFDSGGLDLKPAAGMLTMKKDMAGAAHVLGLAKLVLSEKLPVCLQVLIPAVENAVAGNAYRPGDIVTGRKGLSIEIGNTDAEGRVILSDALHQACENLEILPDLMVDFTTLTGAARIALGDVLGAVFSNREALAFELTAMSQVCGDPLWPLPLYKPYRSFLDSPIADISNNSSSGYGGAIAGALFLQEFVHPEVDWVHFDIMASNSRSKPGRPEGGEAMGLRVMLNYLRKRYNAN